MFERIIQIIDEISKENKMKAEIKAVEFKNSVKVVEIATRVICSYIVNMAMAKVEEKKEILKEIAGIKFFEDKEENKSDKVIIYNKTEKLIGLSSML